jgi:hypothetical protein
LTGDQTLYAHWNLIPYNITYEDVALDYTGPASYTIQTSIEIPNPTKE